MFPSCPFISVLMVSSCPSLKSEVSGNQSSKQRENSGRHTSGSPGPRALDRCTSPVEGNRAKQFRKRSSIEIKTKRSKARAHGCANSAWTGCLTQLGPKSRHVQPLLSFVQTCSDCRWPQSVFFAFHKTTKLEHGDMYQILNDL